MLHIYYKVLKIFQTILIEIACIDITELQKTKNTIYRIEMLVYHYRLLNNLQQTEDKLQYIIQMFSKIENEKNYHESQN